MSSTCQVPGFEGSYLVKKGIKRLPVVSLPQNCFTKFPSSFMPIQHTHFSMMHLSLLHHSSVAIVSPSVLSWTWRWHENFPETATHWTPLKLHNICVQLKYHTDLKKGVTKLETWKKEWLNWGNADSPSWGWPHSSLRTLIESLSVALIVAPLNFLLMLRLKLGINPAGDPCYQARIDL